MNPSNFVSTYYLDIINGLIDPPNFLNQERGYDMTTSIFFRRHISSSTLELVVIRVMAFPQALHVSFFLGRN